MGRLGRIGALSDPGRDRRAARPRVPGVVLFAECGTEHFTELPLQW